MVTLFRPAQAVVRHGPCQPDGSGVFAVGRSDDQCAVAFPEERQGGQPDQLAGPVAGDDPLRSDAQPLGQRLAQDECPRVGVTVRRDAGQNLPQARRGPVEWIDIGAEVEDRRRVEAESGQLREVRAAVNGLCGDPFGPGLWWFWSHRVWHVQPRMVTASRARPVVAPTRRTALPISAAPASARPPPIR